MRIALLTMLLCACTPTQYMSARGEPVPAQVMAECEYEAEKATASATAANPLAGPYGGLHALSTNPTLRAAGLKHKCLQVRGYSSR